jgi:hypothetical protein
MDAVEVLRRKDIDSQGYISQIVVWEVPSPLPGSRHLYKYRLYFGRNGERIIGYDNERGKGDHRHIGRREFPYDFRDVPTLIADFGKDVDEWLTKQSER